MGAFNGVLDRVSAPGVKVVDEILAGSRDLAAAVHRGADTFVTILSTTFAVSFSIVGALTKAGVSTLFFLFISYAGYEITFHTQDVVLQALASVIIALGAIPIMAAIVLSIVALFQSLDKRVPRLRKYSATDWMLYCFLDICAIGLIVFLTQQAKVTFQSPLLAYFQSLIGPVVKMLG